MASGSGPHREKTLQSKFARDPEMSELVRTFVEELPERVQQLQSAFDDAQLADLRLLAQRLSGSSDGHGFAPLSTAARQVANRVAGLRPDAAYQDLRRLETEVNDLIALCERVR